MHDPKLSENEVQRFELEVQQKMQELEFTPSAAVWATIEQAVGKEKKRRMPFFWLFLLAGLLLTGAAGNYWLRSNHAAGTGTSNASSSAGVPGNTASNSSASNSSDPSPSIAAATDPSVSRSAPSSATGSSASGSSTSAVPSSTPASSTNGSSTPASSTNVSSNNPSSINASSTAKSSFTNSSNNPSSNIHSSTTSSSNHYSSHNPSSTNKTSVSGSSIDPSASTEPSTTHSVAGRSSSTRSSAGKQSTASTQPDESNPSSLTPAVSPTIPPAVPGMAPAAQPADLSLATLHARPVSLKNSASIQAAPLANKPSRITTKLSPSRAWEAGFAAGVGISALHQGVFKGSALTANDTRSLAAPIPVTGLSTNKNFVSRVQPDLSFWAGIFLKKPILDNLSVSVGLNLHYYSTKVFTGDKVINNASAYYYSASASLLSYNAVSVQAQSYPYYTPGDNGTFINRYYFLEIPGSVQWQISHNHLLPLFWEVGGTLSYRVSSNAIYYNSKAGVYYLDGNVANKTQFNLSTALMVGIPVKGFQLQAGPQLQYGVTDLLNTQNSSGQHLFYGGLKVVLFPAKAHKSHKRSVTDQ